MVSDVIRFRRQRRKVAETLYVLTQKRKGNYAGADLPCVSFEELGVPFQWCGLLDMREAGMLTMGTTDDGKSGVVLKRAYAEATVRDFNESYKFLVDRG